MPEAASNLAAQALMKAWSQLEQLVLHYDSNAAKLYVTTRSRCC